MNFFKYYTIIIIGILFLSLKQLLLIEYFDQNKQLKILQQKYESNLYSWINRSENKLTGSSSDLGSSKHQEIAVQNWNLGFIEFHTNLWKIWLLLNMFSWRQFN